MNRREFTSKSEFKRVSMTDMMPISQEAWDELKDEPIITLEHTTKFFRYMHPLSKCEGTPCTIHNRTDHNMRSFPQYWRGDRGFVERTCPHGIGHPDPDELPSVDRTHGCDGCCYDPR